MPWDIEYTDEFGVWWDGLSGEEQESVDASVQLLEARGPNLRFPHSSGVKGSKHSHMRELRTQHDGRPFRTLYVAVGVPRGPVEVVLCPPSRTCRRRSIPPRPGVVGLRWPCPY